MTGTNRRNMHRTLRFGAATAVIALLTGCAGTDAGADARGPADQAASHDHSHEHGQYDPHDRANFRHQDGTEANTDVDDTLHGAGLKQLATASDLVVRGRIAKAQPGVLIAKGDPTAKYTVYTVQVRDTVRGVKDKQVEVALLTEIGGGKVAVEDRPNPAVGDDVIWLLTKIAPEFDHKGYVLTNQSGLLLVKADGSVVSGLEGSSPVAKEAKALRTADQILQHLRTAPQR